jgi:hypothetical protein
LFAGVLLLAFLGCFAPSFVQIAHDKHHDHEHHHDAEHCTIKDACHLKIYHNNGRENHECGHESHLILPGFECHICNLIIEQLTFCAPGLAPESEDQIPPSQAGKISNDAVLTISLSDIFLRGPPQCWFSLS